jgi:tRNA (guanine37-N1)-methyltransferase
MKIDIITILPNQVEAFLGEGLFRIAQSKKLVEINVYDLRKWTDDNHHTVDDTPFGGGAGMVMKAEPIFKAVEALKSKNSKVIITTPRGEKLSQKRLKSLAEEKAAHYIIICGHYEGIDERVHEHLADYEISVGDYVLSGGELPALVIVDGMVRLIPGVLGNEDSLSDESFNDGQLEYPQYTRPADFRGMKVPEILLSGDHGKIKEWRKKKSIDTTKKKQGYLVKDQ